MKITKTFRFEASHVLPHHNGKCANLHGHSYSLDVTVAGALLETGAASGMVMDFGDLSAIVKTVIIDRLDHSHLNETVPNPTCEAIVAWIWQTLQPSLSILHSLTLWETTSARASFDLSDVSDSLS